MSFRITIYFNIILIVLLFFMISFGLEYAMGYFMCILGIVLFYVPFKNTDYFYLYFACSLGILITFLLRPLLLIPYLDYFSYHNVGYLKSEHIIQALYSIAIFIFSLMLGLYVGVRFLNKKGALALNNTPQEDITNSFFLKSKFSINVFLVIVLILKFVLITILGVGLKGVETNSQFAFLVRLVPDDIVFFICVVYLFKYKKFLTQMEYLFYIGVIVGFSTLILMVGSKIFIIRFIVALFLFYLTTYGNIKLNSVKVVLYLFIGFPLLIISFEVAELVKFFVKWGSNGNLITYVFNNIDIGFSFDDFITYYDKITRRFVGFDGYIATEMYQTDELKESFKIGNTLDRIIAKVIPFYNSDSITTGKAVGINYAMLDEDFMHSGAVGMLGSLSLTFNKWVYFSTFILGFLFGSFFKYSSKLTNSDLKLFFLYLGLLFLIFMIMSGNFDVLISLLFITLVQVLFYFVFLKFLNRLFVSLKLIK